MFTLNALTHRVITSRLCEMIFRDFTANERICCCVSVLRHFVTFHVISGALSSHIHTVPGQTPKAVYQ